MSAGETVMVIRTPRGFYLRLNDGRFVAIKLPPGMAKGPGISPPPGTTITPISRGRGRRGGMMNMPHNRMPMPPPSILKKLKPGQRLAIVRDNKTGEQGKKVMIMKMDGKRPSMDNTRGMLPGLKYMPAGMRGTGRPPFKKPPPGVTMTPARKLTNSVTITPVKPGSNIRGPPPRGRGMPPLRGMRGRGGLMRGGPIPRPNFPRMAGNKAVTITSPENELQGENDSQEGNSTDDQTATSNGNYEEAGSESENEEMKEAEGEGNSEVEERKIPKLPPGINIKPAAPRSFPTIPGLDIRPKKRTVSPDEPIDSTSENSGFSHKGEGKTSTK